MKRFTKTLFIVLVAVAFVATGCKKESEYTYKTVTLGAKIAQSNSKVHISGTSGTTPMWNEDDVVKVNSQEIQVQNVDGASAELPGVTASDDGYYAYYPAAQVTSFSNRVFTVDLPSVQEYQEITNSNSETFQLVKAPMGAKTDGGSLTFHNLCSLLKVTVNASEDMTLNQIQVTATSTNLSGSTSINLGGTDSDKLLAPETGSKKVVLFFPNGMSMTASESKTFYIYVPEFSSQDVTVEIFRHDNNNWKSYKKALTGVSASANRINTLTCNTTTPSTIGALPGDFSLANGTKVRFSQGNLRYQASTQTWKFSDNQYDYVGNAAGNNTLGSRSSQSAWIDLFGWGTSNYNHGAHEYQPWTVNTDDNNYYAYGIQSRNLYDGDGKADWGYNAISNGGNTENSGWRTLKGDEWLYLLNTRTGSQVAHSYMKARINNNRNGIIVFPDGYDFGVNDAAILSLIDNYTEQDDAIWATTTDWDHAARINSANWTTLQNAGCVFLPAAGGRHNTSVFNANQGGRYWSSKLIDDSHVCSFTFDASSVNPETEDGRCVGRTVRLVQEF